MSDHELRELERRYRESQSVEDEAAWLAARLRSGGIERERVATAALCGHPAALLAAGDLVSTLGPGPSLLEALLQLEGRPALVEVAQEVAERDPAVSASPRREQLAELFAALRSFAEPQAFLEDVAQLKEEAVAQGDFELAGYLRVLELLVRPGAPLPLFDAMQALRLAWGALVVRGHG